MVSKILLTAVMASSIVAANIVATKLVGLGEFTVPAGFLGLALAFLCTDLLSENYGKEAAQKAVGVSAVCIGVGYSLVYAAIAMPSASMYDATAFNRVMGSSAYITAASFITILASQFIDVHIFHGIKERASQKWLRNIGSTVTSQLFDTAAFIVLGFFAFPTLFGGSVTPLAVVADLIIAQYVVKIGVAVLDTPFFYFFSRE